MKVITWKEMFDLKGDVVWAYYHKEESPSEVFIQYHSDNCKRVCLMKTSQYSFLSMKMP